MADLTQAIPLEVWLILCLAPCIISWALGQAHGAWRARGQNKDAAHHGRHGLDSMMFAAPPIPKRRARDPGTPVRNGPDAQQSSAFSGMPTLHELRDQAEAKRRQMGDCEYGVIAEALADDHIAVARAVEDYRYSIAALHQTNRRRNISLSQTLDTGLVVETMPRISDVAPVCPRMRMSELVAQREVHEIPAY